MQPQDPIQSPLLFDQNNVNFTNKNLSKSAIDIPK